MIVAECLFSDTLLQKKQMLTLAKRPTLALDVNIVQDNLPIEIAPRLYLGSIHAAFNQEALSSHKITHVSFSIQ